MKKFTTIITAMIAFVFSASAQTVLVDEDFSGLTDGTESEPSSTALVNDLGDFIDPSVLKPYSETLSYKKWGGMGLYAAGGCIAIKDGWFLNTPAGDMSGNVTITFRARLLDASVDGTNAMDVIFLNRKQLVDFARKHCTLTGDWKTFTLSYDKGNFESTGVQFFCNTEATVLIDDIRIEQEQTSISSPVARDAENVTETSFTAVWKPTAEAEHYLLNVYSKHETDSLQEVTEGFDGIHADADGRIDATNPNYPTGWTFTWADTSAKGHIAQGEGPDGSLQAVRLSAGGDSFTSPKCHQGLKSFSLWVKAEKNQQEVPYGSYVQVSYDTDYGLIPQTFLDVSELLDNYSAQGGILDFTGDIQAFEKVYAVKVEYIPTTGDNSAILFDNAQYTFQAPPVLTYALQDKEVAAPSASAGSDTDDEYVTYDVTGLSPEEDYFYTVRAANNRFVSEPSKEIEVFGVSQPEALPATDVTDSCYTANWTCNTKVDVFRVEQIQVNTVQEDTKDYPILYEDFSKVTSEFKESDIADGFIETGDYTSTYLPIDDLTHIAGWKASSTQRVEGWLGGMGLDESQTGVIAGAIVTPTLNLSHNDGECNVTVRAWGNQGDYLIVRGNNPAAYGAIAFPEGGFVEQTVTVPTCMAKDKLTFYSNNYYPFLIDYIKITQDVKAGDKVEVITESTVTDDASVRSLVMQHPDFGEGHDVCYRVTGLRYYHGDKTNAVASAPSNMVVVSPASTGISAMGQSVQDITATQGAINVRTTNPATVYVYNATGQLVANRRCVGATRIALAPGLYIVRVNATTTRLVVK